MPQASLYSGSLSLASFLMAISCVGGTDPIPKRSQYQGPVSTAMAHSSQTSPVLREPGTKVSEPLMSANPVPPARDPQIAVQEEFDAAKAKGTIAAWDLFLARHNDNLLALPAERERAKLLTSKKLKK